MTIDQNSGTENKKNALSEKIEGQTSHSEFAVYDCEINLKFRLIEEKQILNKRDGQLLQLLLDALAQGADAYLEPTKAEVKAQEVPDDKVSPRMRRHLIRLRNSTDP
ncbi:MAG: Npun_R1517 family heterocyst differentiation transcriptional regulator [Drouetiella hepatica Uher 2000/2452]|jgi:hypothetical protein|uniref:Npun_R1517 family heterocyst differentiation transcriptional regulator n=1 Tax=Drouetiella hepatica Uher 2000/2452 TaxID=904376 RepID=A0A951UMW4_9CYAN|nr:Npun_R1517 family heterocyst differentiation transcriptional regulator [Drouetiella hepatica Uher 2000/2452]